MTNKRTSSKKATKPPKPPRRKAAAPKPAAPKPAANPGPLTLLCKTTAVDDSIWGVIELTPAFARELLGKYRKLAIAGRAIDTGFYAVKFFDYGATFLYRLAGLPEALAALVDGDDPEEGWYIGPAGTREAVDRNVQNDTGVVRTGAPLMTVTTDGVLWYGDYKHADGQYETPEITWADLEAYLRGDNPFLVPPEEAGDDNEESDDDDDGDGDFPDDSTDPDDGDDDVDDE